MSREIRKYATSKRWLKHAKLYYSSEAYSSTNCSLLPTDTLQSETLYTSVTPSQKNKLHINNQPNTSTNQSKSYSTDATMKTPLTQSSENSSMVSTDLKSKAYYSTDVKTVSLSTDRSYSSVVMMPEMFDDIYERTVERVDSIARPYSEIPGPKELPIIGNAWRFAPLIGQYKIHELDKVMWSLHKEYGRIVKVGGLIGHPDLLFVFDGDDIQKVFRREEAMPHRPSMPSLHYYKQHLQKEFFEGNEGVIGVHGPKWDAFRKQVQQILLPPATAKKYVEPLDIIATDFLDRMENMLDQNQELPEHFLSEIYKWALESVARVSLNTRLGCLDPNLSKNSESQRIIDSINTFFWNVAEVELKMPVWRVYKNKAFRKYIGALEDFRVLTLKYINEATEKMQHKNFDNIKEEDISIVERILRKTDNPKLASVLALDLLLVGVDTTSIALASTLYQLSQNPEKQQRLYEELKQVLPNPNSKVAVTAQEKMPYLKACIKETLRQVQ